MDLRSKAEVSELLQSKNTLATVVNTVMLSTYGEEAYTWDPLTIALETKADFGIDIAPEVMDKWCAIQVVMGSDAFFRRIDAFLAICNTLASGEPFFSAFDPVTINEASWAVSEVSLNRDMLDFSPSIRAYIRKRLEFENFGENCPKVLEKVFSGGKNETNGAKKLIFDEDSEISGQIRGKIGLMMAQFAEIPDFKGENLDFLNQGLQKLVRDL